MIDFLLFGSALMTNGLWGMFSGNLFVAAHAVGECI